MNVQVLVQTADGAPVIEGFVSLQNGPFKDIKTDKSGNARLSPQGVPFTITVHHPDFVTQTIVVSQGGANDQSSPKYACNDPGTVITWASGILSMIVFLGRMSASPTAPLDPALFDFPQSILDSLKEDKFHRKRDPNFIRQSNTLYVSKDGIYSTIEPPLKNKMDYWGATFFAATEPDLIQNEDASGWAAINHTIKRILPQQEGNLVYVEWGTPVAGRPRPDLPNRFLVALWRPRSKIVSGSVPRDAILFFHPYTGPQQPTPENPNPRPFPRDKSPYMHNYPYAWSQAFDRDSEMEQAYAALPTRYLFQVYLAYQQIAAAKDALLIFPIEPYGNWEQMATLEGCSRLLAESLLFEHRHRLLPDISNAAYIDRSPAYLEQAIPLPSPPPPAYFPPPQLGIVAVVGYSSGIGNVKKLLNTSAIYPWPSKPQPRTGIDEQKNHYSADPGTFLTAWKETWDLDGAAQMIVTVADWQEVLYRWQNARGDPKSGKIVPTRIVRSYHSTNTITENDPMSKTFKIDSLKRILGSIQHSTGTGKKAREWRGTKGTAVWVRKAFMESKADPEFAKPPGQQNPPNKPSFWMYNVHFAMPMVCFGHAVANSGLRHLEPPS